LIPIAQYYRDHGRKDWSDGLFSGNVTHELTTLVDAKEATTALGAKMKREREGSTGRQHF